MQRRKFLIGVGSLASGSAAAMGTGAFSQVTADRDFALGIAQDSNAYLGLEAGSNDYVYTNSNDLIEFDFDGNDNGAEGLNNRADTVIDDAFTIANNSDTDLYVWTPVDDGSDPTSGGNRSVELLADDDGTTRDISYPLADKSNEKTTSRVLGQNDHGGAVKIPSGESRDVTMRFLIYGSGGPRDYDTFLLIRASEDDPNASGLSDSDVIDNWTVSINGGAGSS